MKNNFLFISGMPRSGTSLIQKSVNSHPDCWVGIQPFPVFHYALKNAFLNSIGIKRIYPIESMMNETQYNLQDLSSFVSSSTFNPEWYSEILSKNVNYSGTWMKDNIKIPSHASEWKDFINNNLIQIASGYRTVTPKIIGFKEVFLDEYIPTYNNLGCNTLGIIRDPRDMMASIWKSGVMGANRPLLYYLRMWRKSVAILLSTNNPLHTWIGYEQLVANPSETLNKIAKWLNIDPFPEHVIQGKLIDHTGKSWDSNSAFDSFSGFSTDSVGRYAQHITPITLQLIEAICFPEMLALGYPTEFIADLNEAKAVIQDAFEPEDVTHPQFVHDYFSEEHLVREINRLSALENDLTDEKEIQSLFIEPKMYYLLKQQVAQ